MHPATRRTLAAGLCALLMLAAVPAMARAQGAGFRVEAKSALLMEVQTGKILFQQDPEVTNPPASLTKIMTLYLAHKAIREGRLKLTDPVRVSQRAWAQHPDLAGSSLMYLEPGQKVTVAEVLRGIAIASGNDASVALAEHLAGSMGSFVTQMNDEARAMGLKETVFQDSHGLSPQARTTAREIAELARRYVQEFPQALVDLHSQREFAYPLPENLPPELKDRSPTIKQQNRNPLLGRMEGVDGLKTGFIDEGGYNLVATAVQGDMRLVGVILGAKSEEVRAEQGLALMGYGFQNFRLVTPVAAGTELASIPVFKGTENTLALVPRAPVRIVVGKGDETRLATAVKSESLAVAPVARDQALGSVTVSLDGKELARTDLVPKAEVKAGGFFKRIWDGLRLLLRRLWGGK